MENRTNPVRVSAANCMLMGLEVLVEQTDKLSLLINWLEGSWSMVIALRRCKSAAAISAGVFSPIEMERGFRSLTGVWCCSCLGARWPAVKVAAPESRTSNMNVDKDMLPISSCERCLVVPPFFVRTLSDFFQDHHDHAAESRPAMACHDGAMYHKSSSRFRVRPACSGRGAIRAIMVGLLQSSELIGCTTLGAIHQYWQLQKSYCKSSSISRVRSALVYLALLLCIFMRICECTCS